MKSHPKVSAICVVIVEVILCLLIYLVFLCFHRRRCREDVLSSRTSHCTGPDESILIFFPYSVIKSLSPQLEKALSSLQCAACLEEFKEDHAETLRFIPKCGHVFHTKCADPCAVLCPCCWPSLGPKNGGHHDNGGGDAKEVVVQIVEKEPVIKLPDEVREKITVHGNLVLPRWVPVLKGERMV